MGVVKCEPGSHNNSCITSNDDCGGGDDDDGDAEDVVDVKVENNCNGNVEQNHVPITFEPLKSENEVSSVCVSIIK
jgi:hypothetical protein